MTGGRAPGAIFGKMSDKHLEIAIMLRDAAWQSDLEGLEDLVEDAMQVAWRRLRRAQPAREMLEIFTITPPLPS